MRKVLAFLLLIFVSITLSAQKKDITKFLGIPIDGTKSAMQQKLVAKGYKYNAKMDCLEGQFNGRSAYLHIVTNNNKVYRIVVEDRYYSTESEIKNRYNTLCKQFSENKKYVSTNILTLGNDQIPDEEDISYEMSANNKRYEASYCQRAAKLDTTAIMEETYAEIKDRYSGEEYDNERKAIVVYTFMQKMIEAQSKKSVWFRISESYGEYKIFLYYDNGYNQANGEDL